jgi:hypothetical protein
MRRIGRQQLSVFGQTLTGRFSISGKSKDYRKATRKKSGADAWIRVGSFATRPCKVVDISDTGVQITVIAPQTVPQTFSLLISRNAGSGRRALVKWRRGTQIGAEFL